MNNLVEKIRRARETEIESCGHKFTIRRPTEMDIAELKLSGFIDSDGTFNKKELMRRFVVGWNLTEVDVIPGGTGEVVAFDSDSFVEWVSDKSELWGDIITAIIESYSNHQKSQADTVKKPGAG